LAAGAALLNPEHPVVLAGLAQAALARGETETAHDLLTRLPANRRTGAIHQLLGRLALLQGDRARAVQLFETAGAAALSERIALGLETDSPEDAGQWPEQHVGLAELASAEGDLDRAIQALNTAVALGWRDEDALRRSPFLGPVLETGRTEPVFERIRQQIAAQAERLDRDEVLTQTLDASLNIQP
jgi:thioredoxin-like negative regulator of GroEL